MHIVEMLFHGTAGWDPVVCSSWAYCGVYVRACNKHHVTTLASCRYTRITWYAFTIPGDVVHRTAWTHSMCEYSVRVWPAHAQ